LLAQFSEPGESVDIKKVKIPSPEDFKREIRIWSIVGAQDSAEVKKIKSIINGMKKEACAYVECGGTPIKYIERLQERQQTEVVIRRNVMKEIELLSRRWRSCSDRAGLIEKWNQKNDYLRDMGFATVPLPLEWEMENSK
jgi:hypothetical protein